MADLFNDWLPWLKNVHCRFFEVTLELKIFLWTEIIKQPTSSTRISSHASALTISPFALITTTIGIPSTLYFSSNRLENIFLLKSDWYQFLRFCRFIIKWNEPPVTMTFIDIRFHIDFRFIGWYKNDLKWLFVFFDQIVVERRKQVSWELNFVERSNL